MTSIRSAVNAYEEAQRFSLDDLIGDDWEADEALAEEELPLPRASLAKPDGGDGSLVTEGTFVLEARPVPRYSVRRESVAAQASPKRRVSLQMQPVSEHHARERTGSVATVNNAAARASMARRSTITGGRKNSVQVVSLGFVGEGAAGLGTIEEPQKRPSAFGGKGGGDGAAGGALAPLTGPGVDLVPLRAESVDPLLAGLAPREASAPPQTPQEAHDWSEWFAKEEATLGHLRQKMTSRSYAPAAPSSAAMVPTTPKSRRVGPTPSTVSTHGRRTGGLPSGQRDGRHESPLSPRRVAKSVAGETVVWITDVEPSRSADVGRPEMLPPPAAPLMRRPQLGLSPRVRDILKAGENALRLPGTASQHATSKKGRASSFGRYDAAGQHMEAERLMPSSPTVGVLTAWRWAPRAVPATACRWR